MTLTTSLIAAVSAGEPLKDGDRVVFLGDSITEAGAGPGGYVDVFKSEVAKRLPNAKIETIGAGISGHRVPDLEKRLDKDVIERKPTVVVIYIGINDVWHSQNGRGTSKTDYEKGLASIIKRIQTGGARVVVCTPSVIGEKKAGTNKLDAMLDEYSELSRKVAAETKSGLIDLRKAFVSHLAKHNPTDAEANVLTTDGVHLNPEGNRFVAEEMLKGLGVASPDRVLRHIVLFKFKPEVTPAQVQEVVDEFKKLPSKIKEIVEFDCGVDNSPEGLSDGLTHAFIVTFKDEQGRAIYLPHAEHLKFVDIVKPRVEKVVVVDFFTK